MKRGIRRFPRLWRASRLARRWYYARGGLSRLALSFRQDAELWQSARAGANGGPEC